ncbi:hypothetical protein BDK51DRAFT_38176 [Blyttiomyces helicus]|uniref:Uncharacterized protein n=1 Tax=Blyttiomyces helicus TaxID=388810 RepID=A0A4P9W712_9FUNG|nr:hypothetical protein BDK51DRAFT_38176 [Blyttiomyces helicus]|eukprot:RKO86788.1 hypothetical protein BDK51DRAFT_38176 [Blyttiomyces helicus]
MAEAPSLPSGVKVHPPSSLAPFHLFLPYQLVERPRPPQALNGPMRLIKPIPAPTEPLNDFAAAKEKIRHLISVASSTQNSRTQTGKEYTIKVREVGVFCFDLRTFSSLHSNGRQTVALKPPFNGGFRKLGQDLAHKEAELNARDHDVVALEGDLFEARETVHSTVASLGEARASHATQSTAFVEHIRALEEDIERREAENAKTRRERDAALDNTLTIREQLRAARDEFEASRHGFELDLAHRQPKAAAGDHELRTALGVTNSELLTAAERICALESDGARGQDELARLGDIVTSRDSEIVLERAAQLQSELATSDPRAAELFDRARVKMLALKASGDSRGKEMQEEAASRERELDALGELLAVAENRRANLDAELHEARGEAATTCELLDASEEALRQRETEVQGLQEEVAQLDADVSSLNKANPSMGQLLEKTEAGRCSLIKELDSTCLQLLQEVRDTDDIATAEIEKLSEDITTARKSLTDAQEDTARTRDELADVKARLLATTAILSAAESRVATLTTDEETKNRELDRLAGRKVALENIIEDLQVEAAAREQELKTLHQRLTDAELFVADREGTIKELRDAEEVTMAEIEQLSEALATARKNLTDAQEDTARTRDELADVKAQLLAMDALGVSLEERCHALSLETSSRAVPSRRGRILTGVPSRRDRPPLSTTAELLASRCELADARTAVDAKASDRDALAVRLSSVGEERNTLSSKLARMRAREDKASYTLRKMIETIEFETAARLAQTEEEAVGVAVRFEMERDFAREKLAKNGEARSMVARCEAAEQAVRAARTEAKAVVDGVAADGRRAMRLSWEARGCRNTRRMQRAKLARSSGRPAIGDAQAQPAAPASDPETSTAQRGRGMGARFMDNRVQNAARGRMRRSVTDQPATSKKREYPPIL